MLRQDLDVGYGPSDRMGEEGGEWWLEKWDAKRLGLMKTSSRVGKLLAKVVRAGFL